MARVNWTPELDAQLIALIRMRLTTREAAERMGMTRETVKKRSVKIGVRFGRWTRPQKAMGSDGHRPFTPRCGEILREHGWRI